jgi:hypothetical protein
VAPAIASGAAFTTVVAEAELVVVVEDPLVADPVVVLAGGVGEGCVVFGPFGRPLPCAPAGAGAARPARTTSATTQE